MPVEFELLFCILTLVEDISGAKRKKTVSASLMIKILPKKISEVLPKDK